MHSFDLSGKVAVITGGRALAVPTDVTDRDALVALADATIDAFGGLDIWVNNAGGSTVRSSLVKLDAADRDACLDLNFIAVWAASVVASERLNDGGSIINITSPAATRAVLGSGHYSCAKAGVNALTLTMAMELAPRLRVNGIAPGMVPTEVMMTALDMDVSALEQVAKKRTPDEAAVNPRRHCVGRAPSGQRGGRPGDRPDHHDDGWPVIAGPFVRLVRPDHTPERMSS